VLSRQFAAGDIDHFTVEKWFLHKDGGYLWADLTGLIQKLGGQVIVRACGRAGVRACGRAGVGACGRGACGRGACGRVARWRVAIDDFGAGCSSLSQLAETMHLVTIAEGIETPTQLDQLKSTACAYGQGYLLARPGPIASIPATLPAMRSAQSHES